MCAWVQGAFGLYTRGGLYLNTQNQNRRGLVGRPRLLCISRSMIARPEAARKGQPSVHAYGREAPLLSAKRPYHRALSLGVRSPVV